VLARPALEVADIFRDHGAAWRAANAGHVSLAQLWRWRAPSRAAARRLSGDMSRAVRTARTPSSPTTAANTSTVGGAIDLLCLWATM